jgi:hypothetical protein
MAKVELQCPSCGGQVALGDIECVHCGVNLKSGEAFESRVKQAKGRGFHPEHFAGGLYIGVVTAFVLVMFAGWMYQKAVHKTMQQRPALFSYPVLRMEELDDIVATGHVAAAEGQPNVADYHYLQARKHMEALIVWIEKEDQRIKPKDPYAPETSGRHGTRAERKYNKRRAKKVLKSLKAKAEFKLRQIPAVDSPPNEDDEGSRV